ncbi:MAG TPA: sigma-54 dependent transcriptional regulator [Polyangia bacterium]|nr:sigma-54 dependent transcriptional regulator [Polyangia bacterium]
MCKLKTKTPISGKLFGRASQRRFSRRIKGRVPPAEGGLVDSEGSRASRAGRKIAVVDDDPVTRRILGGWIKGMNGAFQEFSGAGGLLECDAGNWSVVCLDLGLGDMSGHDALKHLHARDPGLPVVIITADREIESAVEAMKTGAYDYITKPLNEERVVAALSRAIERRELASRVQRLERALGGGHILGTIVGASPAMKQLERQLERIFDNDVSVCLFGQTGTGKELVARAIHERSARARGPFVAVNCAAIADSLLESELFGHERGSFTGAHALHRGCFEQAQGGTLFLDELGEMSSSVQVRLLRALQEKMIRRVGGSAEIKVDVRIIAATHRDLQADVESGRFREDLYYRLAVYPVQIPPLRERAGDIPLLVEHFLRRLAADRPQSPVLISADALDALMHHRWPGNVRELQNVVQRAALACDGKEVEMAHLPTELRSRLLPPLPALPAAVATTIDTSPRPQDIVPLRDLERREIMRAISATSGSVSEAARLLGLGRATLYRRLAEMNVPLE